MIRALAVLLCAAVAGVSAAPALALGGAQPDAAGLRRQARTILSERRFHATRLPRPLHGTFQRIGRWLAPIGRALERFFGGLAGHVPGGGFVLWPVLAALVILAALLITRRSLRRRVRGEQARETGRRALAHRDDDPDELEQSAEEASRAGDLDLALRLRFRAGLVRLDARRAIELRPSLTTGEVSRTLRSPVFAELAATFDEVTYGRRPARADEVEEARREWPRVLEEAGRP